MWHTHTKRLIYFILGLLFFVLGFAGVFLPVLPTTPLMLLALWAFSRSSQRLHDYIWHHPHFGASVRDWNQHGILPRKAKIGAAVVMTLSSLWLVFFSTVPGWAVTLAVATMALVITWLWTRPESPSLTSTDQEAS